MASLTCHDDPVGQEAGIQIRRAAAHEADEAARLLIAARHAAIPAIPPLVHSDAEVHSWFCDCVMAESDVWVALDETAIVAVMVLADGWLEHLYVDPLATNRGHGSALIRHAKSLTSSTIELWTFASNLGAQRFYERHGFVAIDRTAGDNEEAEPDIRYRWSQNRAGTS